MARLTREEQLIKDTKDIIFNKSKLLSRALPELSKRILVIAQDPDTKPEHLITIYKMLSAEAEKIAQGVSKESQDAKKMEQEEAIAKEKAAKAKAERKIQETRLRDLVEDKLKKRKQAELKALEDKKAAERAIKDSQEDAVTESLEEIETPEEYEPTIDDLFSCQPLPQDTAH